MGLYDSLYVECPRCQKSIEFQSKADEEMYCREFALSDVPDVILFDLNYEVQQCAGCAADIQIRIRTKPEGYTAIID